MIEGVKSEITKSKILIQEVKILLTIAWIGVLILLAYAFM